MTAERLNDGVNLLEMLERTPAVRQGHFYFSQRLHSRQNILLQIPFASPEAKQEVARGMYRLIRHLEPTTILAINRCMAYILAEDVAARLGSSARAYFGQRLHEEFWLPSYYAVEPGDRVVLVDEGIITSTSVSLAATFMSAKGADVVGIVAAYSRFPGGIDSLSEHLKTEIYCLEDLKDIYKVVAAGPDTCVQCGELALVEAELEEVQDIRRKEQLTLEKQRLLEQNAYELNWGAPTAHI